MLTRWSRLKRESAASDSAQARPPADAGPSPAPTSGRTEPVSADNESLPELPEVETLHPDSDFTAFMDPRVDDGVRRTALKTLFRHPDFNLSDGLDVYAEDYSRLEKLTPAMVAALKYAQRTLFSDEEPTGAAAVHGGENAGAVAADTGWPAGRHKDLESGEVESGEVEPNGARATQDDEARAEMPPPGPPAGKA